MRLILFRHGPSEERDPERWPDDGLRPLTDRGIRRTRKASGGLARLEPGIACIFSSPALRAAATAQILGGVLDPPIEPVFLDALAPEEPWRAAASLLHREPPDRTIVLVGHEPGLGMLAGAILTGEPRALALKKAGACAIQWDPPTFGSGQLDWWLGPGPLRDLRRGRSGSAV